MGARSDGPLSRRVFFSAIGAAVSVGLAASAFGQALELPGVFRGARLSDLDGDGLAEILVLTAQPGWDPADPWVEAREDTVHVVRRRGPRLELVESRPLPTPVTAVFAADVDGDGAAELCGMSAAGVVAFGTEGSTILMPESFLFEERSQLSLGEVGPDLNGDGRPETILETPVGVEVRLGADAPWADRPRVDLPIPSAILGADAPSLFAQLATEAAGQRLVLLRARPTIADVDGDGLSDLILPLTERPSRFEGVRIHLTDPDTGLPRTKERAIAMEIPEGEVTGDNPWAWGDLDGDGVSELALLSYDLEDFGLTKHHRLRVYGFSEQLVPKAAPILDVETEANLWESVRVFIADVDGDDEADLFVSHFGGLRKPVLGLERYERREDGSFRKRSQNVKFDKDAGVQRQWLRAPVDLDGDGLAEILVEADRAVFVLPGRHEGSRIVGDARRVASAAEPGRILSVLVDRPKGKAGAAYVLLRDEEGRVSVQRVR